MAQLDQYGIEATIKGYKEYVDGVKNMGTQTNDLGKNLSQISSPANSANTAFGGLSSTIGKLVLAATAAVTAFVSFQQLKSAISYTQSLGESVEKLSRETGDTAEASSKLIYQFEHFGMGADQASASLGIFAKKLKGVEDLETGVSAGGKAMTAILADMGVTALDTSGNLLPMSQIIPQIADKFKSMPDGIEKTGLAMQLFGRSGKDMIPFLNEGSAGLAALSATAEKLGLVLSAQTVGDIKKYTFAQRDLSAAFNGLRLQIGVALMPVLTTLTTKMVDLVAGSRKYVSEGINLIIDGFNAFAHLGFVLAFIAGVREGVDELKQRFQELAGGVKKAAQDITDSLSDIPGLDKLKNFLQDTAGSDEQVRKLGKGFVEAAAGVILFAGASQGLSVGIGVIGNLAQSLGFVMEVIAMLPFAVLPVTAVFVALGGAAYLLEKKTGFFSKTLLPAIKDVAKEVGYLGHLFSVGLNGGQIGGEFSKIEKAAFTLGQAAGVLGGNIKDLWGDFTDLVHLFKIGITGGKIGGEFSDLQQAAYDFGHTLRNDVLPVLKDVGGAFKDSFGYLVDHKQETIAAISGLALPVVVLTAAMLGLGSAATAADAALVPVAVATAPISGVALLVAAAVGALVGALVLLELKTGFLSKEVWPVLLESLKETGQIVLPILSDALTTVVQGVGNLKDAWIALQPTVETVGKFLADILVPVFETIGNTFKEHPILIEILAGSILTLINPWIAVVAAIVLVLAEWDDIKKMFVETIPNAITSVITSIEELPIIGEIFKGAFQTAYIEVKTAFEIIKTDVELAINVVRDTIKIVLALIHGDWGEAWNGIKQLLSDVWSGIKKIIGIEIEAAKEVIETQIEVIKGIMGDAWTIIKNGAEDAWSGIKHIISNTFTTASNNVRNGVADIISDIAWLFQRVKDVADAFPGPNPLGNAMQLAIDKMNQAARDMRPETEAEMSALGQAASQGLISGMANQQSAIEAQARALGETITSATRTALRAESPSKVFVDIGADVIAGFVLGLESGKPILIDAVAAIGQAITDGLLRLDLERQLGSLGTSVSDALVKAIQDTTPANVAAMGSMAAQVIAEMRDKLPPDVAVELATGLTDALARALATGTAEDINAVTAWLDKIREAIDAASGDIAGVGVGAGSISESVANMKALENYSSISKEAFGRFKTDLLYVISQLADLFGAFDTKAMTYASGIADRAGKIVGIVGPAVAGFVALRGYTPIGVGAVGQFRIDLLSMLYMLEELLSAFDEKGMAYAAGIADNAQKIVGLIGSAITAFTGLANYKGGVGRQLEAVIDDMIRAADYFGREVVNFDEQMMEHAGKIASSASSVVSAIGTAIGAFANMQAPASNAPVIIQAVVALLIQAIDQFAAGVSTIDSKVADTVSKLGGAAGSILSAMGTLLTAFSRSAQFGQNAQYVAKQIATTLVDIILIFAQGVSRFSEVQATVTSTMSTAVKNLVDAFIALQQNISTIHLSEFLNFINELVDGMANVLIKARNLDMADVDKLKEVVQAFVSIAGKLGVVIGSTGGSIGAGAGGGGAGGGGGGRTSSGTTPVQAQAASLGYRTEPIYNDQGYVIGYNEYDASKPQTPGQVPVGTIDTAGNPMQHGIWKVPGPWNVDNFPAKLAGGEMVLPAKWAEVLRKILSGGFLSTFKSQHGPPPSFVPPQWLSTPPIPVQQQPIFNTPIEINQTFMGRADPEVVRQASRQGVNEAMRSRGLVPA